MFEEHIQTLAQLTITLDIDSRGTDNKMTYFHLEVITFLHNEIKLLFVTHVFCFH